MKHFALSIVVLTCPLAHAIALEQLNTTTLSTGVLTFDGNTSFSASFNLLEASTTRVVLTGGSLDTIILGSWSVGGVYGDTMGVAGGTAVWNNWAWAPGVYDITFNVFSYSPGASTYEWRIDGALLGTAPIPELSTWLLLLVGLAAVTFRLPFHSRSQPI